MENEFGYLEVIDGTGVFWLDNKTGPLNIISIDFIETIGNSLQEVYKDDSIKGVVLISKKKDFIAGADIEYFLNSVQKDEWLEIGKGAHALLDVVAKSKKPTIAAINGVCLGGGLEVALACHGRIISDASHSKLALPEVQLGLLPGGGGTYRLPKLVGLQNALDMLLTGKNIYPSKAKRIGLVDAVVNPDALLRSALSMVDALIKKPKKKKKQKFKDKVLENNPIGKSIIFNTAAKTVQEKTLGNYPAPEKIIECVKAGLKSDAAGQKAEIAAFNYLLSTPESKALQRIFFGMTEKKKNPDKAIAVEIDKIAVLGAGFMGAGVAQITASDGIDVIIKDLNFNMISSAKKQIWGNLKKKMKRKQLSKYNADLIMNRLTGDIEYKGFDKVDLIIEAVFEDLDLKQKILSECESVSKNNCIFASNSSAISIDRIAEKSESPELVIGMHYFSPVPKMPLLEIVRGSKTADWVVATCYEMGVRQGKTCIVVNDGPGFYTTRILAAMLNEALLLLEEGADILKIDGLMMQSGYPVGPFNLLDEVGIDVGAHIMEGELMDRFMERPGALACTKLKDMYEAGYSGRKNNKGFYKYDTKGKRSKSSIDTKVYAYFRSSSNKNVFTDSFIVDRILLAMVNEAAHCLDDNIITNVVDGDIGAIFGLGFPPFEGGPFRYIDKCGVANIVERLETLVQRCSDRFKPAQCIIDKLSSNDLFYP